MICDEGNLPETCTVLSTCEAITSSSAIGHKFSLESLTFQQSSKLISVEKNAFQNFKKIQSVDFTNCLLLSSIPEHLFYNCTSLNSVILPKDGIVSDIHGGAFSYTAIKTIKLPESVKRLLTDTQAYNSGAFSNCRFLSTVEYYGANNLVSIGYYSFCLAGLTSFQVGTKVVDISGVSFEHSSKCFTTITMAGYNPKYYVENNILYSNTSLIFCPPGHTHIVLKSGVTKISIEAFMKNELIDCHFFPSTLLTVEGYIFYSCPNLLRVYFPSQITSISGRCFYDCPNLITVVLPPSLKVIRFELFHNCKSLSQVSIPPGVEEIEANAFSLCKGLSFLVIPDSVKTISKNAFMGSGVETCGILCSDEEKIVIQRETGLSDSSFNVCFYVKKACSLRCSVYQSRITSSFLLASLFSKQ